jgi:trehalose/maltose hydrolase-like predicted phosphorylase
MLSFTILSNKASSNSMGESNIVQLAILLDTSNNMDGLIDQAKSQLWKIVNEMSRSKKEGESINLYVALYEYGNDNLSAEEGYVRLITPLTNDLDKIYEDIFVYTVSHSSSQLQARFPLLTFSNASLPSLKAK